MPTSDVELRIQRRYLITLLCLMMGLTAACTSTQEIGFIAPQGEVGSNLLELTTLDPNEPALGEALSFAQRYTVVVAPTGNRAFASDRFGTIRTITGLDGTPTAGATKELPHNATSLGIVEPGFLIAAGTDTSASSNILVTSSLGDQVLDTLDLEMSGTVTGLSVCDNNDTVLLGVSGSVHKLTVEGDGSLSNTGQSFSTQPIANVHCAPGSETAVVVPRRLGAMHAIDLGTMESIDSREVAGVRGLSGVFSPSGDRFFVRSEGFVESFVYDPSTGDFADADPLRVSVALVVASYAGRSLLAIRRDGTRVFVTDPENDQVLVLDASTLSETGTLSGPTLVNPLTIVIGGE